MVSPEFHPEFHEIGHAYDAWGANPENDLELYAMGFENIARWAFYRRVPGCRENGRFYVGPRPTYGWQRSDVSRGHPDMTWAEFWASPNGWPITRE